jgi:hypothetical protein
MSWGWSAWMLLPLALSSSAQPCEAQTLVSPSAHFGASIFPEFEPMVQFGLHFDRFTEFGKDTASDGSYTLTRRYRLHKTIGLDFAALTSTGRLFGARTTLYRLTAQAGFSNDQPTERFQNKIIHRLRHLKEVPTLGNTRSALEAGVALDVNHWFQPTHVPFPLFAGAGASVSTLMSEAFLQAGVRVPRAGASLMLRTGVVEGGGAFPSPVIASSYAMLHGSLRAPLDDWLTGDAVCTWICALVPEVELGATWTSGFFRRASGAVVSEVFCTLRLTWGPANFETWNDSCGGKDEGPTFGVRLFVRSQAFTNRGLAR